MNDRASEIGMVNSFFTNPTGLSQKTNLSTAEDMCKAVTEAMQSDAFRTIVGTKQYVCCSRNDPSAALTWDNTNKLLAEGWDGVKTGVTPNAGPCLSCSTRGVSAGVQFEVGIVLLQCVSMEARWEEAKLLLQYALERRINY
jgi:serine-type D-Ala-D-Ala carboxypeptidase (penicillin-binding protein 5/6)